MASGQQVSSPGKVYGRLRVGGYCEPILLQALPLSPSLGVVLGKPWLTAKGAQIDFRTNTVNFWHRGRWVQLHCRLREQPSGASGVHTMSTSQQPAAGSQPTGRVLQCSARAMRRELRKGASGFMVHLSQVEDPERLLALMTEIEDTLAAAARQPAGDGAAAGGGGSAQGTTHQPQPSQGEPGQAGEQQPQQPAGSNGSSGSSSSQPSCLGGSGPAAQQPALSVEEQLQQLAAASEVPEVQDRLEALLQRFKQVFDRSLAQPAADYQPPVQCQIPLVPGAKPYRVSSPRPLSPKMLQVLREQLQQLIEAGYIRPSNSEWAAPIVFAEKSDGSYRMCCDMRQLNSRTVRTAYPLPRISEILEQLKGAACFTTLDLVQGFHQVPMAPTDVHKTAFSTRYGLFEWVVMPFGLSGAPGQFMQLMNSVLKPVMDRCCIVFMDDVLVYSPSHEQHLQS